ELLRNIRLSLEDLIAEVGEVSLFNLSLFYKTLASHQKIRLLMTP
ncbi:MAG: hypothetical protein ACI97P_002687, partial [Arcticibacterium sp.]